MAPLTGSIPSEACRSKSKPAAARKFMDASGRYVVFVAPGGGLNGVGKNSIESPLEDYLVASNESCPERKRNVPDIC